MNDKMDAPAATVVRDVFLEAFDLTGAAREEFLDRVCAGDPKLRERVLDLLAEKDTVGGFMTGPASEPVMASSEKPGDMIGRYELLEALGEGGTGIVYLAEQSQPIRRKVALKVIKLGMDSKSVMARFEAERQALALMDHPSIAKVFDAGATESGRPFFVMELVQGVRITDFCNNRKLSTEARLELFIQVCQAIQHAHQKGIIHRDIKPSNILVTETDLGPIPKVIDFGIAKATDQSLTGLTVVTELRAFVGTPAYMSPEQLDLFGNDVDTRGDIYALGVLLYELLTGQLPFDTAIFRSDMREFHRLIREVEPPPPSARLASLALENLSEAAEMRKTEPRELIRLCRGELDWIAMKCLEKDRARRYATTNDLADDVQRFLDGEPIHARPPSVPYKLGKFFRRHRVAVSAAAAVTVALALSSFVSMREAARARRAEADANAARSQAEAESRKALQNEARALLNEYVADVTLAQQALAAGNFGRANYLLSKHEPAPGRTDLRGFEWGYLRRLSEGDPHRAIVASGSQVGAVAVSRDGKHIAAGSREKAVVFNAADGSVVAASPGGAFSITFAPDGSSLLIADPRSIRALDLRTGRTSALSFEIGAPIALSLDGRLLAAGSHEQVQVFELSPWSEVRQFSRVSGPVAFSPNGKFLMAGGREGTAIWPIEGNRDEVRISGKLTYGFFHMTANVVAFSNDGKTVFAPHDRALIAFDAETGAEVGRFPTVHTSTISSVALSSDGKIATGSWDHSIQLWDARTFEHVRSLRGHLNEVWSLAFSPDGKSLLSGAKDGGVFVWPLSSSEDLDFLKGNWQLLGFSTNGSQIAAANERGQISLIDLRNQAVENIGAVAARAERRFFGQQASLSSDLSVLATLNANGGVDILDRSSGRVETIPGSEQPFNYCALAPDGKSIVLGAWGGPMVWRDLISQTDHILPRGAERALFGPGGRLVLIARGTTLQVWNCARAEVEKTWILESPAGFSCALSRDGRTFAYGGQPDMSNSITLMDLESGKTIGTLSGHKQGIQSVAFSQDGRTLASASGDGIKLWNLATLQEALSLSTAGTWGLMFSPDGAALVFGVRGEKESGLRFLRSDIAALARRE